MARAAFWTGTDPNDFTRLVAAVSHNCTCSPGKPSCSAHKLLTSQESLTRFAEEATRRLARCEQEHLEQ